MCFPYTTIVLAPSIMRYAIIKKIKKPNYINTSTVYIIFSFKGLKLYSLILFFKNLVSKKHFITIPGGNVVMVKFTKC